MEEGSNFTDWIAAAATHPLVVSVSLVSTVVLIGGVVYATILTITGVWPVLTKIGWGLATRKIGILANADSFSSLKDLLEGSELFSAKRISRVDIDSIAKLQDFTLVIMQWSYASAHLGDVLSKKQASSALIIYAPQNEGLIPMEAMALIGQHRNVTVVNLRGRLLGDIFLSMVTSKND